MIVPVILDAQQYHRSLPPTLGQAVQFELVWTEPFAHLWSGLRPGWRLDAALRPSDKPTVTHLGATPEEDTEMQPATGSLDGLRFGYTSPIPVPPSLTIEGALRITGVASESPLNQEWTTTGTVRRIQLVSILVDMRPSFFPGWASMRPIAGTEWFYDLAGPPAELHNYRPPAELDDLGDLGDLNNRSTPASQFAVRQEILLLDLEVPDSTGKT